MPTYSYQCSKCEHVFDVFHGMSEKPRVKCERCAGRCKRLIGTGAGVIFKGSGFYETDYKKKTGAPADGKTESKPAADTGAESKSSKDSGGEKQSGADKAKADTAKAAD